MNHLETDSSSNAMHIELRKTMSRSSTHSAPRRVLAVVTKAIAYSYDVNATRDWLLSVADSQLAEFIGNDRAWFAIVSRATAIVGMHTEVGSRERQIESAARKLIAVVVTPSPLLGDKSADEKGGKNYSEVSKRAILAAVGKQIMQDIAKDGFDTAVISRAKLAAYLGCYRDMITPALKWAVDERFLISPGKSGSGAKRYRLTALTSTQREAMKNYVDVVESLSGLAAGSAVAVTGEDIEYPNARTGTLGADDDDLFFDDERLKKRRERMLKAAKAALPQDNPFAEILTGVWEPTGMMADLDPGVAAEVVADILWSVDEIIWRPALMGKENSLTWADWLGLLAGAMGIDAKTLGVSERVIKISRPEEFFGGLVERLNRGERFADLVAEKSNDWAGLAEREARMAAWRESSVEAKLRTEDWKEITPKVEGLLDWFLSEAGAIPPFSAPPEEKEEWLTVLNNIANHPDYRIADHQSSALPSVRQRLVRRLTKRGYPPKLAKGTANFVFADRIVNGLVNGVSKTVEFDGDVLI